jgi:hypothetical protein
MPVFSIGIFKLAKQSLSALEQFMSAWEQK